MRRQSCGSFLRSIRSSDSTSGRLEGRLYAARVLFGDPVQIELPIGSGTVSEIKVDERLIRNAGLFGDALEVLDDIYA